MPTCDRLYSSKRGTFFNVQDDDSRVHVRPTLYVALLIPVQVIDVHDNQCVVLHFSAVSGMVFDLIILNKCEMKFAMSVFVTHLIHWLCTFSFLQQTCRGLLTVPMDVLPLDHPRTQRCEHPPLLTCTLNPKCRSDQP